MEMGMSVRIHLAAQIMEVEREISLRRSVYPGWVSRGKLKQSQSDLHIAQMQAVLSTLQWLQDHEGIIRDAIEERRKNEHEAEP